MIRKVEKIMLTSQSVPCLCILLSPPCFPKKKPQGEDEIWICNGCLFTVEAISLYRMHKCANITWRKMWNSLFETRSLSQYFACLSCKCFHCSLFYPLHSEHSGILGVLCCTDLQWQLPVNCLQKTVKWDPLDGCVEWINALFSSVMIMS